MSEANGSFVWHELIPAELREALALLGALARTDWVLIGYALSAKHFSRRDPDSVALRPSPDDVARRMRIDVLRHGRAVSATPR